jgi:antitoxin HigA-1
MCSASTSSSTTEIRAGRPVRAPTHPGELVAEVVQAIGLPIAVAAKELGVTRQTLHRIIAGRTAVTPEMALRLGRWCGNGPDLWLRMQEAYDLWHARRHLAAELARIPEHDTQEDRSRSAYAVRPVRRFPPRPRSAAARSSRT